MATHLTNNSNPSSWLNFCLLLLSSRALFGRAVWVAELNDPEPNWVLDPDDILSLDSENYINKLVSEIHAETCKSKCVNMRVVAIDRMEGSRQDIDGFAIDIFDKWELGKHGILVMIATGNRKITAKINPGALLVVSSNDAKRAREKIHHYLKQDRWDEGMKGLIQNYHALVMSKRDVPGTSLLKAMEVIGTLLFCAIGVYTDGGGGGDDDDGEYDCDDGGGDSADF